MGRKEAETNFVRFQTTGQSTLKLQYALAGFAGLDQVQDCEMAAYKKYLKLRIRPAAEYAVRKDDTETLKRLYALVDFTEQQIEIPVNIAGEEGKLSSLAWLLRLKKERYGYKDRDFTL